MTKLFTLLAVAFLLFTSSATAQEVQNTDTSVEVSTDIDSDSYDVDGCYC